jgi:hypothetical protein
MSNLFINQREILLKFLKELGSYLQTKAEQGTTGSNIGKNAGTLAKAVSEIIATIPDEDVDTSSFESFESFESSAQKHADTLKLHTHMVFGYLYLIQHTLETTLVKHAFNDNNDDNDEAPTADGPVLGSADLQVLSHFYKTIDLLRSHIMQTLQTKDDTTSKDTAKEVLQSLLKYIGFFKSKFDKNVASFLSKDSFTEDDIVVLQSILSRLNDKPTGVELAAYNEFFEKLDNLNAIENNLRNMRGKLTESALQANQYISSNRDAMQKIVETVSSGPAYTGSSDSEFIDWMLSRVALVRKDDPDREEVQRVEDISADLDPFYYALVELYETISGAVRVYVRTKDVGSADSADIVKDHSSNKLSLEFPPGTPQTFGPFYKVLPTGTTNGQLLGSGAINMKNFISMYKQVISTDKPLNLVFLTYGFSGSGKSYALFNKDPVNKDNQGILYQLREQFTEDKLDMEFESYCKVYGYLENGVFLPSQTVQHASPESLAGYKQNIDTFVSDQLDTKTETLDSFIKSTPNNPQSSRGFLILWYSVASAGKHLGKIGFVDMAGNEDPYDLLIRLCPTLKWPSANTKSFVDSDGTASYGTIDAVCELLQKQSFKYIGYAVRYLTKLTKTVAVANKLSLGKTVANLMEDFEEHVQMAAKEFSLAHPKHKSLVDELNDMNRKTAVKMFASIVEFFNSPSGMTQDMLKKKHVDYKIDTSGLPFDPKSVGSPEDKLFFSVDRIRSSSVGPAKFIDVRCVLQHFSSDLTRKLTQYAVLQEIEALYPRVELGEESPFKTELIEVKDQFNAYKVDETRVADLCDNIMYTLINEPKHAADTNRTIHLMNMMKYASLVKYSVSLSSGKTPSQQTGESSTFTFQYQVDDKMGLEITDELVRSSLESVFDAKARIVLPAPEKRLKTHWLLANIQSVEKQASSFFKRYFDETGIVMDIQGKQMTFSRAYLLRIIQEGFFINQANAELVEFLLRKKDDLPDSTDVPCALNKELFHFEKYDKFRNLTKQNTTTCETYTKIVPVLKEIFEDNATAKYVMLCNIRREKDIKYRLGAIDTLKLVDKLKST